MASSTLLLVVMTACVTVPAVTACQTSRTHRASLESWNWAYYERSWANESPFVTGMELVEEHTEEHLCQANVTFGFYGHTTWVKDGCRGDFDVTTEVELSDTLDRYSSDEEVGLLLHFKSDDMDEAEKKTEQLKLKVGAQKVLIENLTLRVANLLADKATSVTEAPKMKTPTLTTETESEEGFLPGLEHAYIYCGMNLVSEFSSGDIWVFYKDDGTVVQTSDDNSLNIAPLKKKNIGDLYSCTRTQNNQESDHSNTLEIKVIVETCDGVTCHNGGTCDDSSGKVYCDCMYYWYGDYCEDYENDLA